MNEQIFLTLGLKYSKWVGEVHTPQSSLGSTVTVTNKAGPGTAGHAITRASGGLGGWDRRTEKKKALEKAERRVARVCTIHAADPLNQHPLPNTSVLPGRPHGVPQNPLFSGKQHTKGEAREGMGCWPPRCDNVKGHFYLRTHREARQATGTGERTGLA